MPNGNMNERTNKHKSNINSKICFPEIFKMLLMKRSWTFWNYSFDESKWDAIYLSKFISKTSFLKRHILVVRLFSPHSHNILTQHVLVLHIFLYFDSWLTTQRNDSVKKRHLDDSNWLAQSGSQNDSIFAINWFKFTIEFCFFNENNIIN